MLAAAAVLSTVGSVLAFSGVTLVFLAPALVFAAAAGAGAVTSVRPRRPVWLTALVLAVGVPLVVLVATRIGIFILPALGLLLIGLEVGRGARATMPRSPRWQPQRSADCTASLI